MLPTFVAAVLLAAGCAGMVRAQVKQEVFAAPRQPALAVVVIAGTDGIPAYRRFAGRLAEAGFHTVLIGGWDISAGWAVTALSPGDATKHLGPIIAAAQASPQAAPGKVALVGFSRGGQVALDYSGELADQVSAVVAYYPAVTRPERDLVALARSWRTPVLVLAGEKDRYLDCCLIESMRSMESAARDEGRLFELVSYRDAGHSFAVEAYPRFYRMAEAQDAWRRTLAFLRRHHRRPTP